MPKKVSAIPYYGGKSPLRQVGPWIAGLLPYNKRGSYVEAFAGMCGVLLCREPCSIEVINDMDSHLVNWWLTVRDFPLELGDLLENTPKSREVYEKYFDALNKGAGYVADPMERAVAYTVVIEQGLAHGLGHRRWTPRDYGHGKTGMKRIKALANRIREVNIENRDALEIIERYKNRENTVLYLDPPYHSTEHLYMYGENKLNVQGMAEMLKDSTAFVALSGYGDEWDMLGWHKHTLNIKTHILGNRGGSNQDRTEHLWTSQPPQTPLTPSQTLL